jgi:hypothetical protein
MSVPALNAAIQGQGTISADNLNTYVETAQMSSQLRGFTGLPGMVVALQGVSLPNDGLGGFFYWNPSGTEPDDNMNYIVPTGSVEGEWERLTFEASEGPGTFTTITVLELATFESDVIIKGILSESLSTGLSGSGSTQTTAKSLTANINIATTVSSGTGFILPTLTPDGNTIKPGTSIKLINRGVNIASLYPPLGAQLENLGINNPSGIAPGGDATAIYSGSAQWWIS